MPEGLSPQSRIDLGPDASWLRSGDSPEVIESITKYREQLMSEPYYEAAHVRGFLRLPDINQLVADGKLLAYKDHDDYLFPAFQFDPETHQPFAVVSSVNIIMDSVHDGVGVIGWWVQPNARLDECAAPVQLLPSPERHADILRQPLARQAMIRTNWLEYGSELRLKYHSRIDSAYTLRLRYRQIAFAILSACIEKTYVNS